MPSATPPPPQYRRDRPRPGSSSASQRPTSGSTARSSCTTASRSTAVSASRSSTTCTSSCGASPSIARCSVHRRTTVSALLPSWSKAREATLVADDIEDVDSFRSRARAWIQANVGPALPENVVGTFRLASPAEELALVTRDRDIQRTLFDGGFAGICVPREYGGQGLTPAHQRVFNEEMEGHEHPSRLQVPTMTPCLAVLLDFGTDEQKRRLIPPILTGEAIWMQLLSEPSGGSDVAGALTTAVRDGDEWVLNGSKVWTTGAWWSDWGLCLARTNWEVPKHRGLTVFALPLHQDGVEVQQIEMLNGSGGFCRGFLSDVRVPDADRIGEVDDGWTVGTRWMFHERMMHNSPLVTIPVGVVHGR